MDKYYKDGEVEIVASVRKCDGGGFIPIIMVNGKEHWNWKPTGYDRIDAADAAIKLAEQEAEHYVGDWRVQIKNQTQSELQTKFQNDKKKRR